MESATPIVNEPQPVIKDSEATITVAVLGAIGDFNALASTMLLNAMLSGLRRKQVAVISHGDFFLKLFSVMMFTVPVESKAAALGAVRETLIELGLLECATVAHFTADLVLFTNYGISAPAKFEDLFLRPEYFAAARAHVAELERTKIQRTTALMCALCELLAKAKGGTDQK